MGLVGVSATQLPDDEELFSVNRNRAKGIETVIAVNNFLDCSLILGVIDRRKELLDLAFFDPNRCVTLTSEIDRLLGAERANSQIELALVLDDDPVEVLTPIALVRVEVLFLSLTTELAIDAILVIVTRESVHDRELEDLIVGIVGLASASIDDRAECDRPSALERLQLLDEFDLCDVLHNTDDDVTFTDYGKKFLSVF
jgi:hypothetical protein